MNYGDILSSTFQIMWSEKKLWVISALGVSVTAIVFVLYRSFAVGWQMNMMQTLVLQAQGMTSDEALMDMMLRSMLGFVVLALFVWLVIIAGYFLNLVARAGVVAEAARALRGEKVAIGRGLGRGVHKAFAFLAIDLLWALPWVVVGLVGSILGSVFFGGLVMSAFAGDEGSDSMIMGMLGGFFLMMLMMFCLVLVFAIFKGIFAPLMYQSSAGGEKSLGEAISEGWRLARAHIGPLFVILLLFWAVMLGLYMLVGILSLPFSFMFMGPWFNMMSSLENGGLPAAPSGMNWGLTVVATLGLGVLSWLFMSLRQTFYLTLYARIYQELTPTSPPAERHETAIEPVD